MVGAKLVQITLVGAGDELGLHRLICGEALPFRRTPDLNNLLRLVVGAHGPYRLRKGRQRVRDWPESRRLFRQLRDEALRALP
jgi:hypothetical protein